MGAAHPDINRCNFMFADDRRCRNPLELPGMAFCYYHRVSVEKKKAAIARATARAAAPVASPDASPAASPNATAVTDLLSGWLCRNRLDTAAHLNEAINQLFFLMISGKFSARQADALVRMAGLLLKTVPLMKREIMYPLSKEQENLGAQFLVHLREGLAAALQSDQQTADSVAESPSPVSQDATTEDDLPSSPLPETVPPERELAAKAG